MRILDLYAGKRAIWFNKKDPLVTFLDIRESMEPDIVCDTTNMPEISGPYDLFVFDPPHENTGPNGAMSKRYGHWTREQIKKIISGTAKEAHRLGLANSLMALKWNDHAFKLDDVIFLMSEYWRPLFGRHMRNRGGSSAKSQSFWVMLIKIEPASKKED